MQYFLCATIISEVRVNVLTVGVKSIILYTNGTMYIFSDMGRNDYYVNSMVFLPCRSKVFQFYLTKRKKKYFNCIEIARTAPSEMKNKSAKA